MIPWEGKALTDTLSTHQGALLEMGFEALGDGQPSNISLQKALQAYSQYDGTWRDLQCWTTELNMDHIYRGYWKVFLEISSEQIEDCYWGRNTSH